MTISTVNQSICSLKSFDIFTISKFDYLLELNYQFVVIFAQLTINKIIDSSINT